MDHAPIDSPRRDRRSFQSSLFKVPSISDGSPSQITIQMTFKMTFLIRFAQKHVDLDVLSNALRKNTLISAH